MISIIVPVYNAQDYLRRCLDSIVNQTYNELEIICVDDGSTDDSGKIIDEYASRDSRIVVIHKENGGLSSARNAGIDVATGEYMTFVDSDDWVELDAYEICMSSMSSADMIIFGTRIVGDLSFNNISDLKDYFIIPREGIFQINDDDRAKINVCAWNKIYSSKIIKKNNIRFPDGLLNEDQCFYWLYVLRIQNVCFLPDLKYNYYQRSDSLVRKECLDGAGPFNHILVFEKVMQSLSDDEIDMHRSALGAFFNTRCNVFVGLIEDIDDEMIKKIISLSMRYGLMIRKETLSDMIHKYEICNSRVNTEIDGLILNYETMFRYKYGNISNNNEHEESDKSNAIEGDGASLQSKHPGDGIFAVCTNTIRTLIRKVRKRRLIREFGSTRNHIMIFA